MSETAPKVTVIPAKPELLKKNLQRQLRVAAYCRVSTDEEEQLTSYEAQKTYYTDKIMQNKDWTMAGIFADEGITGTSARKRPEFLRMIRLCRQKKIDVVLTKSISRFARNTVDCLNYIRALKELDIAIIFEKENINTLESESEIIITLMGAFAQAESESISQNVRWGIRQSMREGRYGFIPVYGYKKDDDGTIRIIPEQAEVVRRIYASFLMGDPIEGIRAWLREENIPTCSGRGAWANNAIESMLRNEKYCGDMLLQKTFRSDCISRRVIRNDGQLPKYLVQNHHAAIIDRRTFELVQSEIARRVGTKSIMQKDCISGLSSYRSTYALTGCLVCGECGTLYKRCTWARNGKKRVVWRCVSRLEYGTKYCHNSSSVDEEPLHAAILRAINSAMSDKSTLVSQITDAMQLELATLPGVSLSLGDIDRRISELHTEMQTLLERSAAEGGFTAYADSFRKITDEVNTLAERKSGIQEAQRQSEDTAGRIGKAFEILESASPELTEWDDRLIRQLIDTVTILGPDKIRVRLKGGVEVAESLY